MFSKMSSRISKFVMTPSLLKSEATVRTIEIYSSVLHDSVIILFDR